MFETLEQEDAADMIDHGNSGAIEKSASTTRIGRVVTLIAFSHLRWDGVFQRPQQLLTRLARTHDVIVWEECEIDPAVAAPLLRQRRCDHSGVLVVTPILPDWDNLDRRQRVLLDELLATRPDPLVRWYYTPMMLPFSAHLNPVCTVYDCMDELSGFLNAPRELLLRETALFKAVDLVFAGGRSLFEAKRRRHPDVHLFPSSVDTRHFASARGQRAAAGAAIAGYCGVIDERLDLELIADLADQRADLRIEMVGPVVKVAPDALPQRPNLHWLGRVAYDGLPQMMARWQVGLMPFALNEATRFISPTKTPEYLAAGLTVASTAIADVVSDYGKLAAVCIGDRGDFVAACDEALRRAAVPDVWLAAVDAKLAAGSWDATAAAMEALVLATAARKTASERVALPMSTVPVLSPETAGLATA